MKIIVLISTVATIVGLAMIVRSLLRSMRSGKSIQEAYFESQVLLGGMIAALGLVISTYATNRILG